MEAGSEGDGDLARRGDDGSDLSDLRSGVRKIEQHEEVSLTEMLGVSVSTLHDKITAGHIDKMLEMAANNQRREHELEEKFSNLSHLSGTSKRRHATLCFVITVGLLIMVIWLLRERTEVLVPLVTAIFSGGAGFVGGVGYAKSKQIAD